MPLAKYRVLAQKALAASLAAIEIYNKPNFSYREETFSILMINAWELLLKARIVQTRGGDLRSVYVQEARRKKDGTKSRLMMFKRNRSGQQLTIGLDRAAELVRNLGDDGIDTLCVNNLRLLQSIRDSAIHLYNVGHDLERRIYRIGAAALKNFVTAYEAWFGSGLDRYNLYLLPMAFQTPTDAVGVPRRIRRSGVEERLITEIAAAEQDSHATSPGQFDVMIQLELRYVRTTEPHAIPVRKDARDPSGITVTLTDDQIRGRYPWDYSELTARLLSRYTDFVRNRRYHRIRRELERDASLCHVRYLDPEKKNAANKKFYGTNILSHFDQHYARKR